MKCPECGEEIKETSVFCGKCGARLGSEKETEQAASQSADDKAEVYKALFKDQSTSAMPAPNAADLQNPVEPATVPMAVPASSSTPAVPAPTTAPVPVAAPASSPAAVPVAAPAVTPATAKGMPKWAPYAIVGGVCVVILIIMLFLALGSSSSQVDNVASTTTVTEQESTTVTPKANVATPESGSSTQAKPAESAGSSSASTSGSSNSIHYKNSRYGYSITLPAGFTQGKEAENGSGLSFTNSSNGMKITVYGSNNVTNNTFEDYYNQAASGHNIGYSYKSNDKTMFVISYDEGSMVYYDKYYVGKGCINVIRFEYPQSQSATDDKLLEQIVPSFTHGDLSSAH